MNENVSSVSEGSSAWRGRVFGMLYVFKLSSDGIMSCPWLGDGVEEVFEIGSEDCRQSAEPLFERIHPEDRDLVKESVIESARSMQPWRQEFRVELPVSGTRWIRAESHPESGADGSVIWRGQAIDISEQKESELRWMEAAQMLALVADASPKALFVATPAVPGGDGSLGLPYCSIGVAEVFGLSPKEAMDDPASIWRLFSKAELAKGMEAFERARRVGKTEQELVFSDARGAPRRISISIEWVGRQAGRESWVGYATDVGSVPRQESAWREFSSAMEGKIGSSFLDGVGKAVMDAVQASSAQADWFDEPLLWEIEEGRDIEWDGNAARIAVFDKRRQPIGRLLLEWEFDAQQDYAPMLRRAAALAASHWERNKQDAELAAGIESARQELERSSNMAAMGDLVGGVAHDLSSPLGNGALEVEVIKARAEKLMVLLEGEKLRKSELVAIAKGLTTIASSALSEIDKARELLEAFKKIAAEQGRGGMSKHEMGRLMLDMKSSLHPTLRKRGVDMALAENENEIWCSTDVSALFNWLAKCAMAASNLGKGTYAPKAAIEVRAVCRGGRVHVELLLKQADPEQVAAVSGSPLVKDPVSGYLMARYEAGTGFEALGEK